MARTGAEAHRNSSSICGPTEVVPFYKAHEFKILHSVFSSHTEMNSHAFTLRDLIYALHRRPKEWNNGRHAH
jgi:hypothetical protein